MIDKIIKYDDDVANIINNLGGFITATFNEYVWEGEGATNMSDRLEKILNELTEYRELIQNFKEMVELAKKYDELEYKKRNLNNQINSADPNTDSGKETIRICRSQLNKVTEEQSTLHSQISRGGLIQQC